MRVCKQDHAAKEESDLDYLQVLSWHQESCRCTALCMQQRPVSRASDRLMACEVRYRSPSVVLNDTHLDCRTLIDERNHKPPTLHDLRTEFLDIPLFRRFGRDAEIDNHKTQTRHHRLVSQLTRRRS